MASPKEAVTMQAITLDVPESQLIRWVRPLSPAAKRGVLRARIPRLDAVEAPADYGEQCMRRLCAARGLNGDTLPEDERQRQVDELLHEA
jgi:hypothetical protein